ncbi:ankyrin repeat domain-containing protein [Paenibacillus oleatilyticus]|uniref:ankyrin repeat domain-containing protein n=1 Tax=Paenibacillus oleatilyticus TaxID=2594886 RepID=UPI001C1F95B1|nr:ankyrin repeat domain-containing protein [Paenibacillus oleatilyticus]MBU7320502.1 ankyrin repeat domain-containing protein [Paenibacillus oleatilyticus]
MELIPSIDDVFQAAQSGDTSRLQDMLEADLSLAHTGNGDGLTPLGFATHFGNKAAVQVLLDYGADVNALSHSKISTFPRIPRYAAIAGERDLQVIRLLLTRGARTNIFDSKVKERSVCATSTAPFLMLCSIRTPGHPND